MKSLVFNNAGALAKEFPIFTALLRPFSGVNSLVRTAVYLQMKTSMFVELRSPFSIGDSLVLNSCGFMVEGFPALVTLLMIFPTMNGHPTLKMVCCCVAASAVSGLVLEEARSDQEALPNFVTGKGLGTWDL